VRWTRAALRAAALAIGLAALATGWGVAIGLGRRRRAGREPELAAGSRCWHPGDDRESGVLVAVTSWSSETGGRSPGGPARVSPRSTRRSRPWPRPGERDRRPAAGRGCRDRGGRPPRSTSAPYGPASRPTRGPVGGLPADQRCPAPGLGRARGAGDAWRPCSRRPGRGGRDRRRRRPAAWARGLGGSSRRHRRLPGPARRRSELDGDARRSGVLPRRRARMEVIVFRRSRRVSLRALSTGSVRWRPVPVRLARARGSWPARSPARLGVVEARVTGDREHG